MAARFETLDFHEFHRNELPRRLKAGNGALAARDIEKQGALAIQLEEGGESYAYVPRDGGIDVVAGDEKADTVVEMSRESWEGLVYDFESPPGLLYGGRVRGLRGDLMHFVGWEPHLRAMFTGRPIYDSAHPDLRDANGVTLDPTRSFRIDEDPEEMAEFLRVVGYLFVKGAFSPDEVAAFRDGAEALRERAVEGDEESWWGKNDRGESVLCRVISAGVLPVFNGLPTDSRITRLAKLSGFELEARSADLVNGVTVLWKNPDMKEGLSDLPWHRDCGMGGHAIMCPTMVCSVYLESATSETGALRFLPGSWVASYGFADAGDKSAPEGVPVPAEPGDVTIHYGDGMHAAPPPTGAEGPFRSSVLVAFHQPGYEHHRGDDHYNDVLLQNADGQVDNLKTVVGRT